MKFMNNGRSIFTLTALGVFLLTGSCTHPRNTTSYAIVTGHVLRSPDNPVGVEGVTVWLESDSESDLPYYGGDLTVTTDASGEYYARIFIGFITEEDQGSFSFDPEQPQYVGDARILLFYEDKYLDIGGGISIEMGKTMRMPTVYLSQFLKIGSDGK